MLSKELEDYIYVLSRDLIKSNFNINITNEITKYNYIIDDTKLHEIEKYRFHGLISPTIFNICYLRLTKDHGVNKNDAIKGLEELVNKNKHIMELILSPDVENTKNVHKNKVDLENAKIETYDELNKGLVDEKSKKNICIMCRSKELCSIRTSKKVECDLFRSLAKQIIEPIICSY